MRKYNSFNPRDRMDSFVIDPASQTNISIVNNLLAADFIGTDVLIIRSKLGCGATHLLSGVTHELESRETKLFNLNHEWLARHLLTERAEESERQEIMAELNVGSYLVIDHVTSYDLIRIISVKPGKWLGDAILSFLSSGGKLICAHHDNDENQADLLRFLSSFSVAEVYLNYPSFEVAQNIAMAEFDPDFVSRYSSKELYGKCSSVREYENLLVTLLAKEQIYGTDGAKAYLKKWINEGRR